MASQLAHADAGSSKPARGATSEEQLAQLEPVPRSATRAPFWRALSRPQEARAEQLVQQGRALLYPALGLGLLLGADVAVQKRLAIESSLTRFERALAFDPSQREARLYYAKALSFWEDRAPDGEPLDKTPEAIAQLEALRRLDARYEAQEVAFELGVLYTRRHDFARAVAEYRRSLALRSDQDTDSALLGNLAEVTMLEGDLPAALALYDRAARESEGSARVLALWGSAVALDRLGDRQAASLRARRALDEDRAPFAVLHQNGVFFVPAYELHYYEGLGNLACLDKERRQNEHESLAVSVRASSRWLNKPDSVAVLTQLERALAELDRGDARIATASLRTQVARARAIMHARNATGSGHDPIRANAELLPSSREARILLCTLRAAVAFDTYLTRDGGKGPFAEDAHEHLQELLSALSAE